MKKEQSVGGGLKNKILQMFSDFPGWTERELRRCQLMAHPQWRPGISPNTSHCCPVTFSGEQSLEGQGRGGPSRKRPGEGVGFIIF